MRIHTYKWMYRKSFGFKEADISYPSTCPTSWLILQYISGPQNTRFDYTFKTEGCEAFLRPLIWKTRDMDTTGVLDHRVLCQIVVEGSLVCIRLIEGM